MSLLLCLLLLLGQAGLYAQTPQGMTPEAEAQAREVLRQKMAELDRVEAPAVNPNRTPVVSPEMRELRLPMRWEPPPSYSAPAPPAPLRTIKQPVPEFRTWPNLPPRTVPPSTEGPMPPVVTFEPSVEKPPSYHGEGKTLYSFRAEDLELKAALAMFARGNKLNIVPDQNVTGLVTLDIQDLPLDRLMQALLEAHDYSWTEEEGLIRVRAVQTRTFVVDYLRMTREGKGASTVTLSSGNSAGSGGGGSGGGGGMGGGGGAGGGGGMGGGGAGGGAGGSMSGSMMNLKLENPIDFWKELEEQVGKLLTESGRNNLAVNMTAGVIQITDRPSALKRVERFLQELSHSVARQVDIEAKIYDVTLNDQFQFGIDWERIVVSNGGQFLFGGFPTVIAPSGEFRVKEDALQIGYTDSKTTVMLKALQEQGQVSVVSQPRLRTLNNQTAIMKVGRDEPFFTQYSQVVASGNAQTSFSGDEISVITIGTVLTLTPQISTNGWISLDVSPAITTLVESRVSPSRQSSAPVLDIKQTSTIVRVRDGETIIIGGLIQDSDSRTLRKIPVIGDIPVLGKLFQGKFNANQKKELVIFLTPTIVY